MRKAVWYAGVEKGGEEEESERQGEDKYVLAAVVCLLHVHTEVDLWVTSSDPNHAPRRSANSQRIELWKL